MTSEDGDHGDVGADDMKTGDERKKRLPRPLRPWRAFDVRSFDFVMQHLEWCFEIAAAFAAVTVVVVELGSKREHHL